MARFAHPSQKWTLASISDPFSPKSCLQFFAAFTVKALAFLEDVFCKVFLPLLRSTSRKSPMLPLVNPVCIQYVSFPMPSERLVALAPCQLQKSNLVALHLKASLYAIRFQIVSPHRVLGCNSQLLTSPRRASAPAPRGDVILNPGLGAC